MSRGFFAIGIYQPKHEVNVGGLMRSAFAFGASFVFSVGRRYRKQASDTPNTARHIPLFAFADLDDLVKHLPFSCPLVGVEIKERARDLRTFTHPERCAVLLGAEDGGLPNRVLSQCHFAVMIPGLQSCLNVVTAGSIFMYDRMIKQRSRP